VSASDLPRIEFSDEAVDHAFRVVRLMEEAPSALAA